MSASDGPAAERCGNRRRSAAGLLQELAGRPLDERGLVIAPDLDEREMGEACIAEGADPVQHAPDVAAAGDLLGHVLGPHTGRCSREGCGAGQLGVDLPSGREPPELLPGPLPGDLLVLVEAYGELPGTAAFAAASA